MLRIRPSIRFRLLYCVRQSVCLDGRVGNKPIRAVLRTALGVRAGFSTADRFRGRSYTVRQVCPPFLCLSVRPSEIAPAVRMYRVRTGNGYFVRWCFRWQGCLPAKCCVLVEVGRQRQRGIGRGSGDFDTVSGIDCF